MGDYVYVRKTALNTLDTPSQRTILRVAEVLDSGVLALEGENGVQVKEHLKNCAPCHLPIIEPSLKRMEEIQNHPDLYLAYYPEQVVCQMCRQPHQARPVVTCLLCKGMWHVYCLPAELQGVTQAEWPCYSCNEGA